jgi:hypothetical protein
LLISKATLRAIKPGMPRARRMGKRRAILMDITMVRQKGMLMGKRLAMTRGITKASRMLINRTHQVSKKASRRATTKAIIRGGIMDGHMAGAMAGGQAVPIAGSNVVHL